MAAPLEKYQAKKPWERYAERQQENSQAKKPWEKYAKPQQERTWGQYLKENIVGEGDVDTPGEHLGAAINRGGEVAIDAGLATLSGVGEGVMGLLTLPQTVGGLMDAGFEKLTGVDVSGQSVLPDSGALANRAYQETLGYDPQTTVGEFGKTVGSFLPGVALGGTVPQMVTAGVASEAAGQATEGTEYEGLARFGGAMVGGVGASLVEGKWARLSAARDFVAKNSETKPLLDAAKAKYAEGHALGLKIKPAATQALDSRLKGIAQEAGLITPTGKVIENADVRQVLTLLDDYTTGAVTTKQMQALRRRINSLAGSSEPELSRVGVLMKREYDDFLGQFAPQFREANDLNRRAMLGEMMDRSEDLADVRASQFTQSGSENALRTEFRQLDRDIIRGKQKGLRPDQVQAVKDVSRGTKATNAARFAGRMAPRGPVTVGANALPAAIGAAAGVPQLGLALSGLSMGTGLAGQGLATLLQRAAAQRAAASMRSAVPMQLPRTRVPLPGLAAVTLGNTN